MLVDLLDVIDRFQDQGPQTLAFGRRRLAEILAQPEQVAILMRKAQEHSRHANPLPAQQTQEDILAIVDAHPDITNERLQALLEKQQGRRISKARIQTYTRELVATGALQPVIRKGKLHFTLPPRD